MSMGYALWSKTLTITGSIATGSVEAVWSLHNPGRGSLGYDSEPPAKDVSNINCAINGDVLEVLLTNAYPSIDYYCKIDVTSTGTVPVHLDPGTIIKPNMPPPFNAEHFFIEIVDDPNIGGNTVAYDHGQGDWLDCEQLHASDSAYGILHVHFTNEANVPQGSTLHFSGSISLVQWNEYECTGCAANHAPVVNVYLPQGGETYYVGQNQRIEWTMTDADGIGPASSSPPAGPLTVFIDLSSNSGVDGFPCRIATKVYEQASPGNVYWHTWKIPSDIRPYCPAGFPSNYHVSRHNQIRVTVTDPCGAVVVDTTPDFCPLETCIDLDCPDP